MTTSKAKKALVSIEELNDVQEIAEVQLNILREISRNRAL
jgi:hypothetical protein